MELTYKKGFLKDLDQLPGKARIRIKNVLDKLHAAENLETAGVDYKVMEGQKEGGNYFRIRVGRYRIGVQYIRPDMILIVVAARGDIYKTFPPR